MGEKFVRMIGGALAILAFVLGALYLFVLDPPEDALAGTLGIGLLLGAFVVWRYVGKRVVDEREVRISAKANKWGIFALLMFSVIVATMAKDEPDIISVRMAVGGALFATLLTTMIAFQILKRLPNAEQDKWESR